jgi:hypothetical protein
MQLCDRVVVADREASAFDAMTRSAERLQKMQSDCRALIFTYHSEICIITSTFVRIAFETQRLKVSWIVLAPMLSRSGSRLLPQSMTSASTSTFPVRRKPRHRRCAGPLQELQGGRGGIWIDTCQVSVGRVRPNRRDITVRTRDDADDALRSGPEHAGAFGEMVLAQGLGDEDGTAG